MREEVRLLGNRLEDLGILDLLSFGGMWERLIRMVMGLK
jgi:hypothetical protein